MAIHANISTANLGRLYYFPCIRLASEDLWINANLLDHLVVFQATKYFFSN